MSFVVILLFFFKLSRICLLVTEFVIGLEGEISFSLHFFVRILRGFDFLLPVKRDIQENDEEAVQVKEQSILELGSLLAKTGQAAGKCYKWIAFSFYLKCWVKFQFFVGVKERRNESTQFPCYFQLVELHFFSKRLSGL